MDETRLNDLARQACYFRVADENSFAAFLLGFRKGADYDSPNFRWFEGRFDDFVYVDRIVVSPAFRGQRLADRLYEDFEAFARNTGVRRITCEVNVEPPNPASLRFHERRGFREVGRIPYGPSKTVSMLERLL
jgi:predicted GNAT superfamily acetyltransferase